MDFSAWIDVLFWPRPHHSSYFQHFRRHPSHLKSLQHQFKKFQQLHYINDNASMELAVWTVMLDCWCWWWWLLTLWRWLGRLWPTRIDLWIDPISPRRRRVSAGLHATDTLWHAYIDFLTYSDDHRSRQSGLCPSRERSRTSMKDINGLYRSLPAVFEWLSASKGYTMHLQCRCITLWRRLGRLWPTRIDLRIDPTSKGYDDCDDDDDVYASMAIWCWSCSFHVSAQRYIYNRYYLLNILNIKSRVLTAKSVMQGISSRFQNICPPFGVTFFSWLWSRW